MDQKLTWKIKSKAAAHCSRKTLKFIILFVAVRRLLSLSSVEFRQLNRLAHIIYGFNAIFALFHVPNVHIHMKLYISTHTYIHMHINIYFSYFFFINMYTYIYVYVCKLAVKRTLHDWQLAWSVACTKWIFYIMLKSFPQLLEFSFSALPLLFYFLLLLFPCTGNCTRP